MNPANYIRRLTGRGRKDLKRKLKHLKRDLRREKHELEAFMATELQRRDDDYAQLQNRILALSEEISGLERILSHALVLRRGHSRNRVSIGSLVRLRNSRGSMEIQLVDSAEAAPERGKLSIESPLGRALLGAKPQSTVTVDAPNGEQRYRVLQIA